MVVDYQAHWYPRDYFEGLVGSKRYPRARRVDSGYLFEPAAGEQWLIVAEHVDIERQLQSMDEAGIDVMVTSPNSVCDFVEMDLAAAVETAMMANAATASLQRRHPDRVVGLAMLPMQDCAAALQVLDAAVELELSGVCVLSNVSGQPVVSEATMPIFARIDELRLPLFLHPASRSLLFGAGLGPVAEVGLSWMVDTALAALSLITMGVLDECPNLCVVHPHLGGVLPYVAGRVANVDLGARGLAATTGGPVVPSEHTKPIGEYLRERFFVDTVSATSGALRLAVNTYGVDRVLFGTDYPWVRNRPRLVEYVHAEMSAKEADQIMNHNKLPGLRLPSRG